MTDFIRFVAIVVLLTGFPAIVNASPRVCLKSTCIDIEVARQPEELRLGLMNRPALGVDKGMLFVFNSPGSHAFWMKNMLFALDMLWLAADGTIVSVADHVPPCLSGQDCAAINPDKISSYVLEINAGDAQRLGFNTGKRLKVRIK